MDVIETMPQLRYRAGQGSNDYHPDWRTRDERRLAVKTSPSKEGDVLMLRNDRGNDTERFQLA